MVRFFRALRSFLPRLLLFVTAGLLPVLGCSSAGGGGSGGGSSTQVTVSVGAKAASRDSATRSAALVPSTVRSIRVTVRGTGMDDVVDEAPVTAGGQAVVTLSVPSGPGRTFLAQALDGSGAIRYEGSTTVDVAGARLDVAIRLGVSPANPALGHWRFLNPTPTAQDLYQAAYGSGTFVAVGASGTILTSGDAGATWTARFADTTEALTGVAFGGGTFVAVGESGGVLVSSDAGATWTQTESLATALSPVTFGDGRFLVLGDGPSAFASSDGGHTWTSVVPVGLPASARPSAVAFGGGLFHALVPTSGAEALFTGLYSSPDGVTWTSEGVSVAYGSTGLACGGDTVLVAALDGEILVLRPATDPVSYYITDGVDLYGAAFADGAFAVVGGAGLLEISTDPSSSNSWVNAGADTAAALRGCAVGGGTAVAAGDGGMIVTLDAATTQLEWSSQIVASLGPAGFGGGVFVAEADEDRILSSTDGGSTWSTWYRSPPTFPPIAGAPWVGPLAEFAYGGGAFVAVGPLSYKQAVTPSPGSYTPTAYVSTDSGATWSYEVVGITEGLTGVAYGSGIFAATSDGDGVYLCKPPVDVGKPWAWIRVAVPNPSENVALDAVAFGGGVFVAAGAAGSSGAVFTSSDLGQTWKAAPGPFPTNLHLLVHADGVFVAVDDGGSSYTSLDGTTWSPAGTLPSNDTSLTGIAYGGGALVVTDTGGYLYSSADNGATWNQVLFRSRYGLSSVTFGNGAFLSVGGQGTILTSDAL